MAVAVEEAPQLVLGAAHEPTNRYRLSLVCGVCLVQRHGVDRALVAIYEWTTEPALVQQANALRWRRGHFRIALGWYTGGDELREQRPQIEDSKNRSSDQCQPVALELAPHQLLIVHVTLAIPRIILGETALSFLGMGIRPPAVSWGTLLQDTQNIQTVALPWLMFPALFVAAAVSMFNFLGDGLRDAADPYQ